MWKILISVVVVSTLLLSGMTQAADVTAPGDTVQGIPDDGDWPGGELPAYALDDDSGTKYLHFKGATETSGFRVTPSALSIVNGMTFTTANDSPPRDPIAFELYGSNDIDGPYTLIAGEYIIDFAQVDEWPRFTMNEKEIAFDNEVAYAHYEVLFTAIRDAPNANSMQIAEVELLGVLLGNYNTSPADGAEVLSGTTLSWSPGENADSHDVYFGTSSPPEFVGNQAETGYDPGALEYGATYYWQVDAIAGETIYAGNVLSFTTPPRGMGLIKGEVWFDIGGTAVSDLTGNSRYPDSPDVVEYLDLMETPTNMADNYGARVSGYLHVPNTGDYTFWIASDDGSELWLSTSDSPADATVIAYEDSWAGSRSWQTGNEMSDPIALETGQILYIQALVKEGGGGDNLAVAWEGPGVAFQVIPSAFVSAAPVKPFEAYLNLPSDGTSGLGMSNTLSWLSGATSASYDVYLGTNPDALELLGNQAETSLALELDLGETYYWQVDAVEADGMTKYPGSVSSFSLTNNLVLEDFESYQVVPVPVSTEQVEVVPSYTIVPTDPDPTGLLMHWAFEGVGPQVVDEAGKGNFGMLMMGAARTSPGYDGTGSALECLAGTGGHAVAPTVHVSLNGLDALTMSLWVKSDVTETDAGFIHGEDPAGKDDRGMRYDKAGATAGGTDVIKIGVTSTGGLQQLESSSGVQTTDWQHLVMTWSSGNQLALYINGDLDTPAANDSAKSGTLTGYTKLLVGKGGKDGEPGKGWAGLIDDVRIYNYALSYGEVRGLAGADDLAVAGILGPLIAHYEFEGDASDSSGNGFDGTILGDANVETGVLQLDGDGDCVNIGANDIFNFKEDFSISVWVNMNSWGGSWGNVIIGKRGEGGLGWQLRRFGGDNRISFTTRGCGNDDYPRSSIEPSLNEWHHLTAVRDGDQKLLYIDGKLDSTAGINTNPVNPCSHDVYIGARASGGNDPEAYFDGQIDDLRVYYKRAISEAEAASLAGVVPTSLLADTWSDSGGAVASRAAGGQIMRVDYDGEGQVSRTTPFANLNTGGTKALSLRFRGDPGNAPIEKWAAAVAPAFLATNVENGTYDIGAFSGDMTYEFIVNSNPDEQEPSMCLIGRLNFGDTRAGLKYEQWNNTGTYGATEFGVADHDYGIATNPGVDTHLVFVSSGGETALYVNGAYQASVGAEISLSGVVGIGRAIREDGTFVDNFDGDILGVAIYDSALSAGDIQAHSDAYSMAEPTTMSLTLTDGDLPNQSATVLYDGDPTALSKAEWQEWNIDLRDFTGVNTALTNNIAIGLAGSGVMYLDDIRVYTGRCIPSIRKPVCDLNDDCIVDEKDLDVIADSWGLTPESWVGKDVGNPLPGSDEYDEATGAFTITANGHDIWDNSDDFRYVYKQLAGDGEIVARVVSIDGPSENCWRKAGVMIRQSATGPSNHAYMPMTASCGNGASFQRRFDTGGGSSNNDSVEVVAVPYYVKLVRVGNDFSGFISPDGETWTQVGGVETVVMEDPVLIGLAVTSHETSQMTTCVLDSVSITGELVPIELTADLNDDDAVDFDDVFTLLDSWLEEQLWPY